MTGRFRSGSLALVLGALACASPASREGPLRELLEEARVEAGAPGAILAIQGAQGPPVFVATGSDDIAGTTPLGPEQPFYLGSVSKTYTAALVLRLRDLGLLGLVP